MYLYVLPLKDIAFPEGERVAVAASNAIFGPAGSIMAVMIMISTFGCNNGLILAGARVYYTMAKDGLFFKPAGTLNKKCSSPMGTMGAGSCGVITLPQWLQWLLDMISFVVVLFYALTIIGIFVLRKKRP